jgi:hypothetical protein
MASALNAASTTTREDRSSTAVNWPGYHAFCILWVGFAPLPILAGSDKDFHLLVNWVQYLAPVVTQVLPISGYSFMLAVGLIEIAAGLLVIARPRLGAYVVAIWLWAFIANLLLIPGFYDIALRDFGLSLGALALLRLSADFNPKPLGF